MKRFKLKESQNGNKVLHEKNLDQSRESIDLDFGRYLMVVKKYWFPATSVFCFVFFLSSLLTFFLKPSYQAQGKLLFKNERTPIFGDIADNAGDLKSLLETQNPLSTQVEILTSNHLLQQLISHQNLRNDQSQLIKPKELLQKLNVKIIGGTDVVLISYENRSPAKSAQVVNTLMKLFVDNEILAKQSEALEAKQFIAQEMPQAELALQKANLALLQFKKKNKVLLLPKEIEAAVSEISNLESQANTVQADLGESTSRLSGLQSKLGLSPQSVVAVSKLSQSTAVQGQIQQLQQVNQKLTDLNSNLSPNHPTIIDLKLKHSAFKQALKRDMYKSLGSTKVPTELFRNGKLNEEAIVSLVTPDVQQQNYAQLTKDVVAVDLQQQGQKQRLKTLNQKLKGYQLRKQNLTNLEQQQQVLENKVQAARSTYETLLKKGQELSISKNENRVNARIIDPAITPTEPQGKKKVLILLFGILSGMFLASLTVLFLGRRDRFVDGVYRGVTVDELQKRLPYPLLATIPCLNRRAVVEHSLNEMSEVPLIHDIDTSHLVLEDRFRSILSKVHIYKSHQKLKSMLVTSAGAQEGKSFIAANVAATMAHLGKKVLLIDAHFQRPAQHLIWQISNHLGLANLLEDTSIRLNELQMSFSASPVSNLDILPAGKLQNNLISLSSPQRMSAALRYLSVDYDCVVIDAPPIASIADMAVFDKIVDGILLVAKPSSLDLQRLDGVKKALINVSQKVIGVVANSVPPHEQELFSRDIQHKVSKDKEKSNTTIMTQIHEAESSPPVRLEA